MIRKISTKGLMAEEKSKKQNVQVSESEYYLMHPNCKIYKTHNKDQPQSEKDKQYAKYAKKYPHVASAKTLSFAHTNYEGSNNFKQFDSYHHHPKTLNSRPKVEGLKNRAASLFQTPRKHESKHGLKINLASRKQIAIKRLNLKIETTNKKEKVNIWDLQNSNNDIYYSKSDKIQLQPQSKTMRTKVKPEISHQSLNKSQNAASSFEYNIFFSRCKDLLVQYQQKLQQAKIQNNYLMEQNRRLRAERTERNVSR